MLKAMYFFYFFILIWSDCLEQQSDEDSTEQPKDKKYRSKYIKKRHYKYPQSYRDHVYVNMTDTIKELFIDTNSHKSCLEKVGTCIPRGQCVGNKMLYISRVCYKKDLVCCYEDFPHSSKLSLLRRGKDRSSNSTVKLNSTLETSALGSITANSTLELKELAGLPVNTTVEKNASIIVPQKSVQFYADTEGIDLVPSVLEEKRASLDNITSNFNITAENNSQ